MRSPGAYSRLISANYLRSRAIAHFVAAQTRYESLWPAIVFVRRKRHAAELAALIAEELVQVPDSELIDYKVLAITADTSASTRAEVAAAMRARNPEYPVVVATDVWSQGIDIPSIRAVYIAGQGQAPIGGAQRPGRAVRADEDKPGYVVFDVQDMGAPQYVKQQRLRLEHYKEAGYDVAQPALESQRQPTLHDLDLLFLQDKQRRHRAEVDLRTDEEQIPTPAWAQWILEEVFGPHRFVLLGLVAIMLIALLAWLEKCQQST